MSNNFYSQNKKKHKTIVLIDKAKTIAISDYIEYIPSYKWIISDAQIWLISLEVVVSM